MSERKDVAEDEINLIELAKTIWAGRKFIAKVTGVFVVLGLVIAFTSPVEYVASCKLLPESQEGNIPNLGGLGSLAGLAGINLDLGSSTGVLTPELYPEIVNSLPFQLTLLNDSVYFETLEIKTTPFNYFKEIENPTAIGFLFKYTLGLPSIIKTAIYGKKNELVNSESEYIRISKQDWNSIELFRERISIDVDAKSGIINISCEMPDPLVAAKIADNTVKLLTKEVTSYKIEKAKNKLQFVLSSFNDAKDRFETAQTLLAKSKDQNRNVSTAIVEIDHQRLQTEYNIAFEVYKGLASQVEQAKIKLKEETPVFTVLEPVRIPENSSNGRLAVISVVFFLGIFISICIIFIKEFLLKRIENG